MNSIDSKIVLNKMRKVIIATIQTALTENVLESFKNELLLCIELEFKPFLILDFSGLDILDIVEFEEMQKITQMAFLMGVKSYYVSLSPGIVASLIQMNVNISKVNSALNSEEALHLIENGLV
jgi:rsbT antagonist protein RsbS